MKIDEILDVYRLREVNRRYDDNEEILGLDESQSKDQAKQSLLEAIEKAMPKEKDILTQGTPKYDEQYDPNDEDMRNSGYNQALQDCLTNLKELFGEK